MSWKTDLAKSVTKIDKATALTGQSLDILINDFQEHKRNEKQLKDDVTTAIKTCPESSHIKLQNGKLDRVEQKLSDIDKKYVRYLIGAIGLVCTIVGFIANWKEIFGG